MPTSNNELDLFILANEKLLKMVKKQAYYVNFRKTLIF